MDDSVVLTCAVSNREGAGRVGAGVGRGRDGG